MDDLIRRSAVIDVLKETGIIQDNDLGHLVVEEINRIPVAYNVDKVKKYFEDKTNAVKQTPYINDYLQNLGMQTIMVTIINDLLRIVEKGDVDDDIDIPFW